MLRDWLIDCFILGALDSGGERFIRSLYLGLRVNNRYSAHGVIVPLLYTADDAEKLVQSAKFPPTGQRGFGSVSKFLEKLRCKRSAY